MAYISSEHRQRNAFVERSIIGALQELENANVARNLGSRAAELTSMLNTAVVADVVHGEVRLPEMHDADTEAVPIVALRQDEGVMMSGEFQVQTDRQRTNTLRALQEWSPRAPFRRDLYNELFNDDPLQEEALPFQFAEHSPVTAFVSSKLLGAAALSRWFARPPIKGIAVVRNRPVVLLGMQADQKAVPADALVHELVHARQHTAAPLSVIHSQRSSDMATLRLELEAYQAGAVLSYERYRRYGAAGLMNIDDGFSYRQLQVEQIRHEYWAQFAETPPDPYKVTGALLQRYTQLGFGPIIEASIDYENAEAAVARQAEFLPMAEGL